MSQTAMVYGKFLIVDADHVIPNGAAVFRGDRILAVGSYADMVAEFAPDRTYGSGDMIVAPGFVNAHGHGRGV